MWVWPRGLRAPPARPLSAHHPKEVGTLPEKRVAAYPSTGASTAAAPPPPPPPPIGASENDPGAGAGAPPPAARLIKPDVPPPVVHSRITVDRMLAFQVWARYMRQCTSLRASAWACRSCIRAT